jgi:uncharacterized protein (DUF433 family)
MEGEKLPNDKEARGRHRAPTDDSGSVDRPTAPSFEGWYNRSQRRTVHSEESIMPEFRRITFTPGVMGGQACIRGMRIPVSLLVNLVANGMTADEIIKEYPDLESEDERPSGLSPLNQRPSNPSLMQAGNPDADQKEP